MVFNLKVSAVLLAIASYCSASAHPIIFVANATIFIPSGITACGFSNIPSNALVAGVAAEVFDENQPAGDSNPHDNALCGNPITVAFGDESVTVEVVERCAGCTGAADLILSPEAYKALTGNESGTPIVVDWQFGTMTPPHN